MSERYILREQEFHTGVPLPDGCKDMEAGEGYVLLVKAKDHDAELQALRDEVARLRGIMEEAASAPGKDWLEWQLKLGAALTPQGKGQQVLKSGQSQEISSYAEGKGGGNG